MRRWQRIGYKLRSCWHIMLSEGWPSFAQIGEDRILYFLFSRRGIERPSYIDIGANEPVKGSNTYLFYLRGAKGVCIEPDPALYQKLKQTRPRDICLNVGIGLTEAEAADFYCYPPRLSGYNTFSGEEAEYRATQGQNYKAILQIPLKNINRIIAENLGAAPQLMSIDVEGLDLQILQSLDFKQYAPMVLVVETIRFGDTEAASKQADIIDFVLAQGYSVYADTFVNTIFLKNS